MSSLHNAVNFTTVPQLSVLLPLHVSVWPLVTCEGWYWWHGRLDICVRWHIDCITSTETLSHLDLVWHVQRIIHQTLRTSGAVVCSCAVHTLCAKSLKEIWWSSQLCLRSVSQNASTAVINHCDVCSTPAWHEILKVLLMARLAFISHTFKWITISFTQPLKDRSRPIIHTHYVLCFIFNQMLRLINTCPKGNESYWSVYRARFFSWILSRAFIWWVSEMDCLNIHWRLQPPHISTETQTGEQVFVCHVP